MTRSGRGVGDPLEGGVGVVVAGLQSVAVQDGEAAEAGHLGGEGGIDGGVQGAGDEGDGEAVRAELPARSTSRGSTDRALGASATSSKP